MAEKSTQHYLRSLDINAKLISSIDNGIIILDSELTVHYYNTWLELHTSIKEESTLGRNICDIFTKINEKTLKRKIRTALRMGTPTFYTASTSKYLIPIKINQLNVRDFKHMRQDVSVIPFDSDKNLVALIITDQTNITNTLALLETNILKVQELNKELIKERETIDQKVLLIKFNLAHTITNASKAYMDLIGCDDEEVLKHNFFQHQKLHIAGKLKEDILAHIRKREIFKFENKSLSFTGKELVLSFTLVPEYDNNTNHIGFILFMQDITNSKKVIAQHEKLLATSKSAAMGEMISMIAHQWRQPLSVINTIMATLRIKHELDTLEPETMESSFDKIEETVSYLSNTIDDFRDYFKPNKIIEDVLISNIIDKSTMFLLADMELLDIKFSHNIDENLSIKTYQNELIQCIINIFKNSIDAFREITDENKTISLVLKEESTLISLCFKDNAGGIDPAILNKIYDPYFSTKAKNGTGLGLYMTKTIIEEHLHGKITITSRDNTTTTLIELPYLLKQKEQL